MAAMLVTLLCLCCRFYGDAANPDILVIQAIFKYSREELIYMGETATSFQAAISFRDTIWFVVLFPVLAVFPWIHEFADQWNGGNYYLVVSRKTRMRYAVDHVVRGMLSAFFIIVTGVLIYVAIVYIKFPLYRMENAEGTIAFVYGSTKIMRAANLCKAMIHTGILASVWSVLSMIVIVLLKNQFWAVSIPMLVGYSSDKLDNVYQYYLCLKYDYGVAPVRYQVIGMLFPSRHLFYDMTFSSAFGLSYGVYLILLFAFLILIVLVFVRLIKRRNV